MASLISVAEIVRMKDRPESEWYLVERIFPDTHRAKVHVIGLKRPDESAPARIVPLDDLIPDECVACEFIQRAI